MMKQKSINGLLVEIGEKVKQHRYNERQTFDELAGIAKVSTVLLSQLEKNEMKNISLKKLMQVANAIGFKLEISLTPFEAK